MSNSNAKGINRLFLDAVRAAAAEDQDPEAPVTLSDERLSQALRGERPLNDDERRQVLVSAQLQERVAVLSGIMRIEARDFAADLDWPDEELTLLAAADDGHQVRPIHFEKPLYSVDLIPIDAAGRVWRINIQLDRAVVQDLLGSQARAFKLVDTDGLTWLRGMPNEAGELVGFWQRDEDLLQRLERVRLSLKPA